MPVASIRLLLMAMAVGWIPADDDKTPSFPVDEEAKVFAGRHGHAEWIKDEVFTKGLGALARSGLSPEAKTDAFILMQQEIGWLFAGALRNFPRMCYAQTSAQMLSTYFQYQQANQDGHDVAPLLKLAATTRAGHPLRASNALLLATLLNPKEAKPAILAAIDAPAIAASTVPAIDLHNLCLAAALTGDPKVVEKLFALLPTTESEESREDVLVATSLYQVDLFRDLTEAFLRREFPGRYDNAVVTALQLLAREGGTPHFREFYKSLADLSKSPEDRKKLADLWDARFLDKFQRNAPGNNLAMKIWDGFQVTVDKGGAWISDRKSFRYWIRWE